MALSDETSNGNGLIMPVSPMMGNGYGNGCFGGDGWWVILFLFALMGNNGFGGWGGGNNDAMNYFYNAQTQSDVNRGFADSALSNQLSGIQTSISNGFANAEVAACNRSIDSMTQRFNDVLSTNAQMNNLAMSLQNCCCENRAAVADLKYTIAQEACADRAAVSEGTQRILDQMCQDKIDSKNEKIAELQNQLTLANLAASQNLQTQQLIANNEAQTAALEQYLAPVPRPAYVVQNPNCCQQNYGCGCGNF